jgi:menaquinone reductase, multiheme cytochrome c subunit
MKPEGITIIPRKAGFWTFVGMCGVVLLALPFVGWSWREAPQQPIRFSHKAHFEEATCEACHLYVMELPSAGIPKLSDCLDCHDGPQSENEVDQKEEAKLDKYAAADEEIPWIHLPRLAPDVYFSHRRHVALGDKKLECKNCHGDIGKSKVLPMERKYAFTMSFCVDCHEKRRATTDCLECHR